MPNKIYRWLRCCAPALLILLLIAICAPFFNNPLVFDDIYFFLQGAPEKFLSKGAYLSPRWWPYQTLALTFSHFEGDMFWLRAGNLALHISVGIALFALIRRLIHDLDNAKRHAMTAEAAAFFAAAMFAFHPLANFAQGYLIQRTILCSTLFALLCLLLFWRGLSGSRLSLWGSCLAFALSIFAKEHSVMLPALCFLMFILYMRSGTQLQIKRSEVFCALLLQGLLALFVAIKIKGGIIGATYEPLTGEMLRETLPIPAEFLYPLSALNQAGLFFKYIFLWAIPNPGMISLDIREAFPLSFGSWLLWGGALLYVAYGASGAYLLLRGRTLGLIGLSMLGGWLLFFTEFSAVRLQEPFVLYRSYLWAPLLFVLLAIGIRRLNKKLTFALIPLLLLFFAFFTFDRLTVLSHPYHIWDEAALLLEKKGKKEGVLGGYRIYYNRGMASLKIGLADRAITDFERSVELNPNYGYAHHAKGAAYLRKQEWHKALMSFNKAVLLLPKNSKSWLARGFALKEMGKEKKARMSFFVACQLGNKSGCERSGDLK